jgi:hypothetical protein
VCAMRDEDELACLPTRVLLLDRGGTHDGDLFCAKKEMVMAVARWSFDALVVVALTSNDLPATINVVAA